MPAESPTTRASRRWPSRCVKPRRVPPGIRPVEARVGGGSGGAPSSVMVVLLVVVAGGAGYAYYLSHGLNRINVKGLNQALNSGKEAGTENILMVGSTSRCALKVQNPAYGLCSRGQRRQQRRDHDPARRPSPPSAGHSLPPPRPVRTQCASDGPNKIDAGLYQGISQVVAAVQEDFGIPDPTHRLAQLRPIRQRGRCPRRDQHVLPDVGVRRRVRAQRPGGRMCPPQRNPGPRGRAGPPPPVPVGGYHDPVRRLLAPRDAQRPRPYPP